MWAHLSLPKQFPARAFVYHCLRTSGTLQARAPSQVGHSIIVKQSALTQFCNMAVSQNVLVLNRYSWISRSIPPVQYPCSTGVFAVFLCTQSDFPRGREQHRSKENDWQNPKWPFPFACILHSYSHIVGYRFGYRFFEVVRSIPVQYLTIGFPAPLPNYASKVGAILSLLTHTHTHHTHHTHTHRHTHTHKCQLRSIGHVGCLFRKCPPFNTPRYPPVQYLPFNTPVQYPIEQKAAAYPPGTGGFDTYPYFAIQKCFSHVSSISPCRPTLLLSKAFVR